MPSQLNDPAQTDFRISQWNYWKNLAKSQPKKFKMFIKRRTDEDGTILISGLKEWKVSPFATGETWVETESNIWLYEN